MFKPTVIEMPKSESFNQGAPNTGQPGDPAAIAPPRDLAKSRFQPIETVTPQPENVTEYAPGTGQPGDGTDSDRGYRVYDGPRPQAQTVTSPEGYRHVFISDLPEK